MTTPEQRIARVVAKRRERITAWQETWALVRRVLILALAAWLILSQVFLVTQVEGQDMFPAVKDGDLALLYRLQRTYRRGDVTAYRQDGVLRFGRIAGMPGDQVIITPDGTLTVNGMLQSGEILFPTTPRTEERFVCDVPQGCVFILGDYRTQAVDSRDFGVVSLEDVEGKLLTLMRRREL